MTGVNVHKYWNVSDRFSTVIDLLQLLSIAIGIHYLDINTKPTITAYEEDIIYFCIYKSSHYSFFY